MRPYLREWPTGIAVLYSDYVKDVNARIDKALKLLYEGCVDEIRNLKVE